jgi:hypothetical protein
MSPLPPCAGGDALPPLHSSGIGFHMLGVWQRSDACWYELIAAEGYRPGSPSAAFHPFFPVLTHITSYVLADDLTLSGLAVAGGAYIAAMLGLFALVRDDFGEAIARRAVVFISLFPTAFFFFAPFTEALFLALCVWALHMARRGLWWWAALLALLAGITRTQGVLLALPLAWLVFRQWRVERRWRPVMLVPILPALSYLGFLIYSKLVTGWTMFQVLSIAWAIRWTTPWSTVATSWQFVMKTGNIVESCNLVAVLLCAGLLLVGLRRLPVLYSLFALPQFLLDICRTSPLFPLESNARYMLTLFPAFVMLAILLRQRRAQQLWFAGSGALLGVLLGLFTLGAFVG